MLDSKSVRPLLRVGRPGAGTARASIPSSSIFIRHASTSTSTSPNPPQSESGSLPLAWPRYFALRRQRRLWSTLTTIPTTVAGLLGGGSYFASLEADPTQLIMGIEPMFVYGGATFGCMALGYLLGPTLGSSLFSLTHASLARGNPAPLEIMDREFFNHIKRNRGDPSFQSVNNIAPDFYGEKVVSLPSYRRWLRDQAAYKRKAMHGVPDEAS
ncbi:mitochondrial import protein Pam17 [Naematelia encephala]|uniref:Presequence translocated-associated motor subunit PAM17 n=1 Tax=Naematelia encephala TaxID=71784 RepID=A0A1Y2BJB9_9TREE|nr:mitochondrial import protein Pam17 [Naematelia encephala]